jgi:hypothetical protein
VIAASGCTITEVKTSDKGTEFDRLDEGLPVNFGALAALNFFHIPFPQELNRYMITIKGLPVGRHTLTVDGRAVGTWPAAQWAEGINISSATADGWVPGGPWDAQANVVLRLTEGRSSLDMSRLMAIQFAPQLQNDKHWTDQATELNARMEALQQESARPRKYHFVVQPAVEAKK